ncbi:MAG: hypothetical protein R2703_02650 [Micropruina glycogenica]
MSGLKPLMRETREAVLKGAARAKDRLHQVADNMNDHVDDVARRVRAQDKFDDKPSLPPKNEIPLINGRRPINSKYAGRVFDGDKWSPDLAKKYPDGVRFTNEGFPDFSPYAEATVKINNLTGDYASWMPEWRTWLSDCPEPRTASCGTMSRTLTRCNCCPRTSTLRCATLAGPRS